MDSDKLIADIAITPQENLVKDIYMAADAAIACELERLRSEEGIVPTCKLGCSHPISCYAVNDPESTENAPIVLKSILIVTSPFSMMIKDIIEKAGMDFSRSMMLLPHWLAIEMDWDFAISP